MNDQIYDVVALAVQRQSWYQKNANTIVAALGALAMILSFVLTLSLDLPGIVVAGIGATVSVLTTLRIKLTPNGFQENMAERLKPDPAFLAELERTSSAGRHRAG